MSKSVSHKRKVDSPDFDSSNLNFPVAKKRNREGSMKGFKSRSPSFIIKMLKALRSHNGFVASEEELASIIHKNHPEICFGNSQIVLNRVSGVLKNSKFHNLFKVTKHGIFIMDGIEVT